MSMTPAPASVPYGEETEYSFEERRLGFVSITGLFGFPDYILYCYSSYL